MLWRCWLGGRKGIPPVENLSGGMLAWYLSGARCRLAYGQLTLLPLTVSCSSKIQIGFTFLVPAHPGSPGKRAVKRVCVCVCVCVKLAYYSHTPWGNKGVAWRKRLCKEQRQVHVGEECHARPGWTTSRRGQDSPWKSQSEWQRTRINGESTSMVWPTLRSRTAKDQNRTELIENCSQAI